MSYKIEIIPNSFAVCGEGPFWSAETQNLYYVDLDKGKLMRYSYVENRVYESKLLGESFASFIIPIENTTDKFAVGCLRRVVIVHWDGISVTCHVERTLFSVQPEDKYCGNRFNDAKCDFKGRLYAGTMRYKGDEFEHRYGELYMYDRGKVSVMKSDCGLPNGMDWNTQAQKFYFIDTADYSVREFDYNITTGAICKIQTIV